MEKKQSKAPNTPCDNCGRPRFLKLSRYPPYFFSALVMLTYLSNKYTGALIKRGQRKNAGKKRRLIVALIVF